MQSKRTKSTINKILVELEDSPLGLSFGELMTRTKLSKGVLDRALNLLISNNKVSINNGLYLQTQTKEEKHEAEPSPSLQTQDEKADITTPSKPKRHKPFTPNPIRGYDAKKGKVKIFLKRKACSHVLTLTLDDLEILTNAIKKA